MQAVYSIYDKNNNPVKVDAKIHRVMWHDKKCVRGYSLKFDSYTIDVLLRPVVDIEDAAKYLPLVNGETL